MSPLPQIDPVFEDEALQDLAMMFRGFPEDPVYEAELLNKTLLDFSPDSLKHVELYLEAVSRRLPEGDAYTKLVLRAGAYLGEVIRRNILPTTWHWMYYNDAVKISPNTVAKLERSLSSAACLYHGNDGFTFPMGKVIKRLENGNGDDVHFFATVMIALTKSKTA